jgi:hypothetical protein
MDGVRKNNGRRRKNRRAFESGHGTRFEALIISNTHWHEYEAARNGVKLGSFLIVIVILIVIIILIC